MSTSIPEEFETNRKFMFLFNVKCKQLCGLPPSLGILIILLISFSMNIIGIVGGFEDKNNTGNMILSFIRIMPAVLLAVFMVSQNTLFGNIAYVIYCLLYLFYVITFIVGLFYYIIASPGPVDEYNKSSYYASFFIVYIVLYLIFLAIDFLFIYTIFIYIEMKQSKAVDSRQANISSFELSERNVKII